jgi:hypothetical protein
MTRLAGCAAGERAAARRVQGAATLSSCMPSGITVLRIPILVGPPVTSDGRVLNAVATVNRSRGSWKTFVMGQPVDGTWTTPDTRLPSSRSDMDTLATRSRLVG